MFAELIMSQDIILLNEPTSESLEVVNIKEHIICHCQTKLNFKIFDYIWNISNFSIVYKSLHKLPACKTEDQPFNITATFDKQADALYFCSLFEPERKKIKVNYYNYIQATEGIGMPLNKKNVYLSHDIVIYKISVKDLYEQKSMYLSNDTLIICFHFEIIESLSYSYIKQTITETEEFTSLNTISNIKSNSLVTFIIDEKQLYINKDLLCSKSDYFEAMFNSGMKESKNDVIEINDIMYDVFKYLISYIETGSLANLKMNAEDINYTETLYDLIIAADKYNIQDLMFLCEKLLIKNASKYNVVKHLNIAHLNNAQFLKQYAIKFLKLYENVIEKTSDFKILMQTFPQLLIQIKNVKLDGMIFTFENLK